MGLAYKTQGCREGVIKTCAIEPGKVLGVGRRSELELVKIERPIDIFGLVLNLDKEMRRNK